MICDQCQKLGQKLTETMTFKERVHMLTAVATMRKYLDGNINAPSEDKIVSSSITTKLLLSFPEGARGQFLQMLRQSAGVEITLNHCGHGIVGVVT